MWRCWRHLTCQISIYFSSSSDCSFIVIVTLCCGNGREHASLAVVHSKGHICLCSGHKVGWQSESSRCDSAGAFRHRQVKKEKSTWMNSQICEQRWVQKEYTQGINQHIFSLYYLYIQCNLFFFSKEIHRKIIETGVRRAPQGTESFCVSRCTVLCTPFTH